MKVRPSAWLCALRQRYVPSVTFAANPFTAEGGRLGTRARIGAPGIRWEDAVTEARSYIDMERISGLLKSSRRKNRQQYAVKQVSTLSLHQLERFDEVDEA